MEDTRIRRNKKLEYEPLWKGDLDSPRKRLTFWIRKRTLI